MKKWIISTILFLPMTVSAQGDGASKEVFTGSLDKAEVREVIQQNYRQIQICYLKQLAKDPNLSGKITLEWVVKTDGQVRDAKETQSTLADSAVSECISAVVKTMTFPSPKGGEMKVVFPWVFKPIRKEIICSGDDSVILDGQSLNGDVAIKAFDNCALKISDSVITGKVVAIQAAGNATIVLHHCTVTGPTAIAAGESSRVKIDSSTLDGAVILGGKATLETASTVFSSKVSKHGKSEVEDGGKNKFGAQ